MMKKKWMPINLIDYFIPRRGKESNMASLQEGSIPLISAKSVNNGLKGFVNVSEDLVEGNVITLNNDGDGGAGLAYYQPTSMALDSHVTALITKQDVNENAQIYIACCLSGLHDFFGHGHSISNSRVEQIKVMLPVNNSNIPDWNYMTSVVKEKRKNMLKKYYRYISKHINEINFFNIKDLSKIRWGKFTIEEVFTISPGKRLEKRNMIGGKCAFIGATDNNNGVTSFVGNINSSLDKNVLGINYNGSVCEAFYHPYDCIFSDDVKRLHLKEYDDNKYVLLFIGVVIRQQKVKYQYAYKFNEQRMQRQTIMLPVTFENKPDYKYMEQYAMNMMKRKYEQYIKYINNKI